MIYYITCTHHISCYIIFMTSIGLPGLAFFADPGPLPIPKAFQRSRTQASTFRRCGHTIIDLHTPFEFTWKWKPHLDLQHPCPPSRAHGVWRSQGLKQA